MERGIIEHLGDKEGCDWHREVLAEHADEDSLWFLEILQEFVHFNGGAEIRHKSHWQSITRMEMNVTAMGIEKIPKASHHQENANGHYEPKPIHIEW